MRTLYLFLLIFYCACTFPEEKKGTSFSKSDTTTIETNTIETNDANTATLDTFNSTPLPVVKKVKYPSGIYRTVLPLNNSTEQIIAFNKDFTYQLQEKYISNKKDSVITIEGNWTPSDGFIWLYKDQIVRGRYKWRGDTLQYYSPLLKKNFSMKPLQDAMQNAVWKNKGRPGIKFFGSGNEPFWNIELNNRDSLSFLLSEWNQPLRMKIDSSFNDNAGNNYIAHNDSVQMRVTVSPHFCSDGMSDFIYRNKVKVEYNQQTFSGCGIVYNQ
jgi:uncharacterized membrane protein